MRRLRPLLLSLVLLAVGGRAPAQPTANPPAAASASQPIALEFDRIEIQRVAQTLSERTHRSVLLDDTVRPGLLVSATGSAKTMEEALDRLTRPLELVWKKIYVTRSQVPVNGAQAAALVKSVREVTAPGIVVEDRSSKKVTLYMRDLPSAPDLEAQIHTAWPFLEPVYLVSDPKAKEKPADQQAQAPKSAPERFAQMERQRMQMLMQMTPEERAQAVQQGMALMLQTDPTAMQEMMRSGMQAWVQTMQTMTPEQRQQMMNMSMQMMRSIPPETWQNLFQMFRPGAPPPPAK